MWNRIKKAFDPKISEAAELYLKGIRENPERVTSYEWSNLRSSLRELSSTREWVSICKREREIAQKHLADKIAMQIIKGDTKNDNGSAKPASSVSAIPPPSGLTGLGSSIGGISGISQIDLIKIAEMQQKYMQSKQFKQTGGI